LHSFPNEPRLVNLGVPMANLLLIDDNPALIAEQVRQTFPPPSYDVAVAQSGCAGVDQVRSHSPID
jgi:CheY-like chemotaxis protein